MTTKAYEIGQFGISLVVTDAGEITALSINTNQVSEGTNNKYYTDTRVRSALSYTSGSAGYNSTTGAISIPSSVSQLTNDTGFITSHLTSALRTEGYAITGGNYDSSYVTFAVGAGAIIGSTQDGNVYVQTGTGGTVLKTWQYKANGELLFPDATTQSTAWTGSVAYTSVTGRPSTTDNITEGSTNLYYTGARVGTYLTSNNYATQTYVGTAISNLVNSAPSTLDTLNELATALGNDANFATTIATSIGTKLSTSDFTTTANTWLGTKTADNLTEGSTNQYFTTTRARASVSGGTIISYNSSTGVIGVNDASIGVSKFDATVANTFSTKGTSIAMAIALG